LRGLLAEEMESLLYVLGDKSKDWKHSRDRLLGVGGRMTDETGIMRVGDARLPEGVRRLIAVSLEEKQVTKTGLASSDVLEYGRCGWSCAGRSLKHN
jgi:hypothetical protein